MVAPCTTESVTLRPEPQSAGEARRFTREVCEHANASRDMCDVAVLLTSEAVTNAIVHGRSEVRLKISAADDTIRVEVGDDNSRRPVVRQRDADALDGRGMALLEAVATDWGVRDQHLGKVVWFEVTPDS